MCLSSQPGFYFSIIAEFLDCSVTASLFLQSDTANYVAILNYLVVFE